MSAKGGITEGKSHKEGGIPMEVKSTGQKVELEGGEGVINKRNMASEKTFEFEGKEKTICEIASEINSADGNGVQIDCDNVTGKKYEYATGGKILDEESEANFKEWMDDGNVYEVENGIYTTQDAQWTNRVKGMDELRRYYAKEFLSDSYAKGGGVDTIILEYPYTNGNFQEYIAKENISKIMNHVSFRKFGNEFRKHIQPYFTQENNSERLTANYRWSELAGYIIGDGSYYVTEEQYDNFVKSFNTKYEDKKYEGGGSVEDYKSLIGKYVNIYSMGVSLPTENQIKDVMVSGEQFRHRDITLKFDIGNAKIPLNEADAFMQNEIIYVKDSKEEFGIQLIPNQYAKGGRMPNSLKIEDYETASMSAGGYEEQMIVPQDVTGIYENGGAIDSKRENLEYRLWNERGFERSYLNKLSFKDLRSLYDTEFYYDEDFEEGGGVDGVKKTKVKSYQELQNHPLVDSIEREYNAGAFDGTDYTYWLYLKDGYIFESLNTSSLHEGFKKDLIRAFNEETIVKKEHKPKEEVQNNYRISVSQNDKYIGEYPNPIATLGEAKSIFLSLETKYKRPQYLISVSKRPTSTSGLEKINVDDWYEFAEKFEGGGNVREMSWYKDFEKDQLKKGTEHEMEHIDTIREFKKKGVSDREVAKAIAQDHLDEDENYYEELDQMESRRKLAEAIKDFEKYKGYRKSARKFKHGGYMGDSSEIVHLTLNNDVDVVIRDKEGNYVGEAKLNKDKIYKFAFKNNDGKNSTLEYLKGAFIVIPNEKINIVGFDEERFGNGGSVKPYQSIALSDNDKQIAKLLTKYEDPTSYNSKQRQKLASFKGTNVVNQLSNSLIQKIYGLLFEYHNIENPIKNLYLSNVGAGNIVSFSPKYIEKLMIDFDEQNQFVEIEKDINSILNQDKEYVLSDKNDLGSMDAFIHVYSEANPQTEDLIKLLVNSNKSSVALGVCEFTSRERLNSFQHQIVKNQGAFALNQEMIYKNANKYMIVNEGITNEGEHTLIYVVTKY